MSAELPAAGVPFCVSWSGGKDSCLALWRARSAGARPALLLTMFTEDGERTRSHGLHRCVVEAQAAALGVPLLTACATWAGYEQAFTGLLRAARERGVTDAVFGDIDLDEHRAWEERVCADAGLRCRLPLWREPRRALLEQWWGLGFSATVVAVKAGVLPEAMLGQVLDRALVGEIEQRGADCCGEAGEYHTLATAGPAFGAPLRVVVHDRVLRDGVWFADVALPVGPIARQR